MKNRLKTCFTLVEVVIALAILAIGVLAAMSLLASSRDRSFKASNQWKEQHILSQAVEYYMLAGPVDKIPEEFFPYDDYSVSCEYVDPEDLPDGVDSRNGNWKLVTMHVTLRKDGDMVRKIAIDRIVKDTD